MASRYDDDNGYGNRPTRRGNGSGRTTAGSGTKRYTEDDYGDQYGGYDDGDDYEDDRPRRSSSSGRSTGGSRNTSSARRSSTGRPSGNRPSGNRPSAGGRKPSSGKKMSRKARERKKRKRIILFVVEIVVLAVMIFVLWAVTKVEKVGIVDLNENNIEVNSEVADNTQMESYRTIALFGVDSTSGELTKNTRSDTIIVANINLKTKEVKLVSVYRDTFLNVGGDSYNKCNSAYAKGGPEQAINMLNQNLDLQIKDFVTIGFEGLSNVIDNLGGVSIDVQPEEIVHLNNYQKTIAEDLKTTYTPVTKTGVQTLNGLQATAYCRIRYTSGNDFKRAQRQRTVLKAIMDKAKAADAATLTKTANGLVDDKVIYTSLKLDEILSLLTDVSSYSITADGGFPKDDMRATGNIGSKGSCVVPMDLEGNVKWLHSYLFDENDYDPSSTVKEYSSNVASETGKYDLTKQ